MENHVVSEDTIKILQMMIDSYNQRGGGYSQKQALHFAIKVLQRIDVDSLCNFLMSISGNPAMTYERKAQAIVDYLTQENK